MTLTIDSRKHISSRDYYFANIALNHAKNAEGPFRHGSVCVLHGKIISHGHNNYRTRCRSQLIDSCSCHAEVDALRKILLKVSSAKGQKNF